MEKYLGEGILVLKNQEFPVTLELLLNAASSYELLGVSEESILPLQIYSKDIINIELKNIILKKFNEDNNILENKKIDNLFISKISNENRNFKFVSRSGFIEMNRQKKREVANVYVYSNISQIQIGLEYKNIIIKSNLQENQKRLDIIHKNEKTISEETLEIIVCALQLLQGHYIKKSVEELQEKVIFYMYGSSEEIPNRANSILKEPLYNNNFLYRTLEFLFNLSENDRKKWKRAFQLFISYKNSNNIDLLVRLLQFFDVFKAQRVHYKDNLVSKFGIEISEAIFITKIRNDLVHGGLFLDESLNNNFHFLEHTSTLKILLQKTDVLNKRVFLLAFYIEEIVTKYIISKLPKNDSYLPPPLFLSFFENIQENCEFNDFNRIYNQIIIS